MKRVYFFLGNHNRQRKKIMALRPEVDWNESVGLWQDTPYIWNAAPGFLGRNHHLTIVRTTHPAFCDSMRLFGLDSKHPARLECHTGVDSGFRGTGWFITLESISPLGVCRYHLRDGGNANRCLGTTDANDTTVGWVTVTDNSDAVERMRATWYLVPAPRSELGWSIVHGLSGKRLEATSPDGKGLQMSAKLMGFTYWDVLRHSPNKASHRSHFWLPPFLARTMGPDTREGYGWQPMESVIGTVVKKGSGAQDPKTESISQTMDCLKKCEDEKCDLVMHGSGQCTLYKGWTALEDVEGDPLMVIPGAVVC